MLPAVTADEDPYPLPPLVRFRVPADVPQIGIHTVTLSDLDENCHVNNALALDILEDAAAMAAPSGACSRRLREAHIHYAGEARLGETLVLYAAAEDGQFLIRTAPDGGKPVHEAQVIYEAAPAYRFE